MKLGFVVPYPKAGDMAMRIAASYGVEMVCKTAPWNESVEAGKELLANDKVSAIIARKPISQLLISTFGACVAEIGITNYSFLKALEKASMYCKQVAFVFGAGVDAGLDIAFAERILGIQVICIKYDGTWDGSFRCLDEVHRQGIHVLVTSTAYAHLRPLAIKYKIQSVVIKVEEEALVQAIQAAIVIAQNREKAYTLSEYMNNDPDGIIAFDNNDVIWMFNRSIEQITGLSQDHVCGHSLQEIASTHSVFRQICDKQRVIITNDAQFLVVDIPCNSEGGSIGKAVKLIQMETTYKREHMIRQSIGAGSFRAKYHFSDIIGSSQPLSYAKEIASRFAHTTSNILITGESGTGKELFAQSIHNASAFRNGPFVAINCAALPEKLFESELYGYEDGAFTGARRGGKIGLFELSNGGTLFLDEIGELTLSAQVRLLRSIQERQIIRVGGNRTISIANRIICATNRRLEDIVQQGNFREDLFYRINVLRIHIPSIRERKEDIQSLAKRLSEKYYNVRGERCTIPSHLLDRLTQLDWPGNVRQLEAFIESLIVTSDERCISDTHFTNMLQIVHSEPSHVSISTETQQNVMTVPFGTLSEMTNALIRKAYEAEQENATRCAHKLGISRSTLWRKLQTYD